MFKLNLDKEWDFISNEVHNKKHYKQNPIKRELLATLQIQLSQNKLCSYYELKKLYLSY